MSIRSYLIPSVALLAMAVATPAQEPVPDKPDGSAPTGHDGEVLDKQKLIELDERRASLEAEGREEKEKAEAGKPSKLPGLERHVSTLLATRPQRIGPGGTGTVHVILAMMDTAVLRPGGQLEILYGGQLGPLTFGSWTIDPALPGTLPTQFRGQPVYDNTALVRIPVQVAPDAEYGNYNVSVTVTAEVTDGETGAVRGVFYGSARGKVTVGDPLPTPVPAVGPGGDTVPAVRSADVPDWQPGDAVPGGPVTGAPAEVPLGGRVEQPAPSADDPAEVAAEPFLPSDEPQPAISWLWVIGGILALGLGAVGVAAASRRS